MTDEEIALAFYANLAGIAGLPEIVWPNEGDSGTVPRVEVSFLANRPETFTIGGGHRRRFLAQATVITGQHKFEGEARGFAELIIAAFAWNSSLADGLRVHRRPYTAQGFADGADWKMPVTIDIEYIESNVPTGPILPQVLTLNGQVLTLNGQVLAI